MATPTRLGYRDHRASKAGALLLVMICVGGASVGTSGATARPWSAPRSNRDEARKDAATSSAVISLRTAPASPGPSRQVGRRAPSGAASPERVGTGGRAAPRPTPNADGAAEASASSRDDLVGPPLSYGTWGAGYEAIAPVGQRFTAVSATFVVPRRAPPPPRRGVAWVAIWAGIGIRAAGWSQLMQAGVYLQTAAGRRGWSLEMPWWINESANPTNPHEMMLNVEPGDRVVVTVRQAAHHRARWTFTIRDLTNHYTASAHCWPCRTDARSAVYPDVGINGLMPILALSRTRCQEPRGIGVGLR